MPDPSLSDAVEEAYASAPVGVITLDTMELWHPTFAEPIRVVRGYPDTASWVALGGASVQAVLDGMDDDARALVGLVAKPEAGAARNAGEYVPWIALAFDFDLPAVEPVAVPEIVVTMDNVGRELSDHLNAASESGQSLTVIYRPYLSIDIEGPQQDPPLELTLTEVRATPLRATGRARMLDIGNRTFPGRLYTPRRFPNLAR